MPLFHLDTRRPTCYKTAYEQHTLKRIHNASALILCMAIIFTIGFFLSKREPFGAVNPFAVDPYDAISSFAFQAALLAGILTYARALRWKSDPSKAGWARLILCGNILVLGAILLTLLADAMAEFVQPFPPSYWGSVLIGDLAALFGLTLICGLLLVAAYWRVVKPGGRLFLREPLGAHGIPLHDLRSLLQSNGWEEGAWSTGKVPLLGPTYEGTFSC